MRLNVFISVSLMNINIIVINHVNISDMMFGSFRAERKEEQMEGADGEYETERGC